MRCREASAAEPLAGTAPLARWWWLVEVAGPWGRDALRECRVEAVRGLESTEERRVLLVRRRGRHPATDPEGPITLWIAGSRPDDPPPRAYRLADHTLAHAWPPSGPPAGDATETSIPAPVLAVCANSARDLCCGLDGRALVQGLDDDRVWECSHLGGHRFAPTALLVGSGLVYGRLTVDAARGLLDHGPTASSSRYLRGRSSLPAPAQAAEAYLLAEGIPTDIVGMSVSAEGSSRASVTLDDGTALTLSRDAGEARPVSCGGTPEPYAAWRVIQVG
jgi:hypothetical protein